jgi:hypothetical protein
VLSKMARTHLEELHRIRPSLLALLERFGLPPAVLGSSRRNKPRLESRDPSGEGNWSLGQVSHPATLG